jgi:hypothetical protein
MTKTKDISHTETRGSQRTTFYVFENPADSAALRENVFSSSSPAFVLSTRETMKTISHTGPAEHSEVLDTIRIAFLCVLCGFAREMKDA